MKLFTMQTRTRIAYLLVLSLILVVGVRNFLIIRTILSSNQMKKVQNVLEILLEVIDLLLFVTIQHVHVNNKC